MAKMLIHIHSGHEAANKATLGLLVALTASKAGHDVTLFLAGDGVHLLAPSHAHVEGQGTGRVGDHLEGLASAGVTAFASGKSAQARGYDEAILTKLRAEFAMPDKLVELATAADTVLCY